MAKRNSENKKDLRVKRIGVALTAFEHRAVVFVAEANGLTEKRGHSLILRRKSINQCVKEYRRLKALAA